MCLIATSIQKKSLFGYKMYKVPTPIAEILVEKPDLLFGATSGFGWANVALQANCTIESNRPSVNLTAEERSSREVNLGLHIFMDKEEALKFAKETSKSYQLSSYVVIKVMGDEHSFVASGVWGDDNETLSAVFKELFFESIEAIYCHGAEIKQKKHL